MIVGAEFYKERSAKGVEPRGSARSKRKIAAAATAALDRCTRLAIHHMRRLQVWKQPMQEPVPHRQGEVQAPHQKCQGLVDGVDRTFGTTSTSTGIVTLQRLSARIGRSIQMRNPGGIPGTLASWQTEFQSSAIGSHIGPLIL